MYKKFHAHLTQELKKLKSPARKDVFFAADYIGGGTSKLIFWNIKVPHVRAVLDPNLFIFSESLEVQFAVFERIWFDSEIFEVKSCALHWLEGLDDTFLVKNANRIVKWVNAVDNWAHSDALCGVLARMFDHSPSKLLPTFRKWNKAKNPWLRRCSMVSLFYYSRSRTNLPSYELAVSLIKPHLGAPEYYVQKGVGWTIREMYNCYPTRTLKFITDNLHKIHADAWYAATEKLPKTTKLKLVQKRRDFRRKVGALERI